MSRKRYSDECTREYLAIRIDRKITLNDVVDTMHEIIEFRRKKAKIESQSYKLLE